MKQGNTIFTSKSSDEEGRSGGKRGEGTDEGGSWAVIVDIFTVALGIVFAVGIAARYFLAPLTQSLFAMYLSTA